ncbi:hypothetical protein PACTADRAFT_35651 [Pachysolen tannophilus NRRL Y-2460]|uniref:FAR1 domain-containing protein n=1 Tax=Pachysolen tannophilus NRRL Y-2460 TaxID=669874 RepID=A0A1E4TQ68_PACTA|nr:hypothetical protein PACTADRAFT_35651 [Pachysolen tannophilus NRRL Y-2460]
MVKIEESGNQEPHNNNAGSEQVVEGHSNNNNNDNNTEENVGVVHHQSIPQYSNVATSNNNLPVEDPNLNEEDILDENNRKRGRRSGGAGNVGDTTNISDGSGIAKPLVNTDDKKPTVARNSRTNKDNIGEPILTDEYFITPIFEPHQFTELPALKEYVKDFSKHNGFNIAIAHSNNKAIYFTCELGGAYRNKNLRRGPNGELVEMDDPNLKDPSQYTTEDYKKSKRMGSKKICCPFSIVANFSKKKQYWTLRVNDNHHNHPKLNPDEAAPIIRKRNNLVNDQILHLYKQGDKPSKIQERLVALFPEVNIKREDIYNEIRILKKRRVVPASRSAPSQSKHDMIVDLNEDDPAMVAATASSHHDHSGHHQTGGYHTTDEKGEEVDVAAIIAATKKNVEAEAKEAAAAAAAAEAASQLQQVAHLEAVAAAAAQAGAEEDHHKKHEITNAEVDDKLLQIDERLVGEGN